MEFAQCIFCSSFQVLCRFPGGLLWRIAFPEHQILHAFVLSIQPAFAYGVYHVVRLALYLLHWRWRLMPSFEVGLPIRVNPFKDCGYLLVGKRNGRLAENRQGFPFPLL